jgi:DNA-binding response OmpR family regulator
MDKIIILIDDDEDDQFIFNEVVRDLDLGFKCMFANDGVEGMKLISSIDVIPDYFFIDLNMPKKDGKQCLAEIKKMEKFKNVPVVIYTTSRLQSDIDETEVLGSSYYLTKPGMFTELQKAIKNVLTGKVKIRKPGELMVS